MGVFAESFFFFKEQKVYNTRYHNAHRDVFLHD